MLLPFGSTPNLLSVKLVGVSGKPCQLGVEAEVLWGKGDSGQVHFY